MISFNKYIFRIKISVNHIVLMEIMESWEYLESNGL